MNEIEYSGYYIGKYIEICRYHIRQLYSVRIGTIFGTDKLFGILFRYRNDNFDIISETFIRYISVHFSVRIYRHMPDNYLVKGEHRNLSDNFIYTIYKGLYIVYIPAIIKILILIYMRIYININSYVYFFG